MKNLKIYLALFTSFLIVSCEGPRGTAGADGNANVTIIEMEINSSNWQSSGEAEVYVLSIPEITSDVVSSGYFVTASLQFGSNDSWALLPFISAGPGYTESLSFSYSAFTSGNNAYLYAYADDDETTVHEAINTLKVAIIEGFGKREITIEDIESNPDSFNITYIKI
jgi:hypothetical protein